MEKIPEHKATRLYDFAVTYLQSSGYYNIHDDDFYYLVFRIQTQKISTFPEVEKLVNSIFWGE